MRTVLRVLLSRWVTSFVGTALLAALVWEFGPLWPPLEPPLLRVLAIQPLFVVWLGANALLDARRRSRDTALQAGLSAAKGEEVDAVGQTLAEAMGVLKRSGGQRGALLEQPWYAIIGPPGAGKTTALLNAGLRFPLAEQMGRASVAGVGGTRLCEWWFTDRAVLIDTAGRYTTQDSDAAVDSAGWGAFLTLLKRTRPRQPLNGVIVAIALPDVVQAGAAERDGHAAAIRARIAELESSLGVRMPVYALFTKADLIVGFTEFFDGMDREARDQVWGSVFPLVPAASKDVPDWAARFTAGFRPLVARLNARLADRLQAERRLDRRGAIAGFPTQFASLEKPLASFVAACFGGMPGRRPAMLRGVFFASGTQEGTPIDRLTGALSRAFGIDGGRAAPLRPEQGRSFFLGHLLRDVVFGEAMLVREAPGAARRRTVLRATAFAAVLVVVAGAATATVLSSLGGTNQVDAAEAALASYEQAAAAVPLDPVADGDLRPVAALLDAAAALDKAVPATDAARGFEQGGKLVAGARAAYRNALTNGLLPRLVWRLEAQMRGNFTRPEVLYSATRIYLMLGGAGPLRAAQVRDWMVQDWEGAYPAPEDAPLRASLLTHLDNLLNEPLPALALDGALVDQARTVFGRIPLADRVYAGIRSSAAALALAQWRPIDVLRPAGAQIFVRASGTSMNAGIPGLYTAEGYKAVVLPALAAATQEVASESWVLGRKAEFAPSELRDLQAAVTQLYANDYAGRWGALVADLATGPISSLPQAAQYLYILSSPESPLRALLRTFAVQLVLPAPAGAPLAQRFGPLLDLVSGDGAPLDRALRAMADMQQPLAKLAALPVGTPIPPGGEDLASALQAEAARLPPPVNRWVSAVATAGQAARTGTARAQAASFFNAANGPAQLCREAVARYPFAPNGQPLPLEDFGKVFGRGGVLDGFFNTQVKSYLDTTGKVWRPQSAGPTPVSAADAAQFQRAAAIRDAFFPAGKPGIAVQFELESASPDGGPAALDLGGTAVGGRGPAGAAEVTWPPQNAAPASLSFPPAGAPALSETGPWAMFRLFARGRLQPGAKPGSAVLSFNADGRQVAFNLRSGNQNSPFTPGLFTEFRCPAVQ